MPHGLVLLARRQVTLVVLRSAPARIEKKLRESDIRVPAVIPLLIVHKAAEAHQRLLHLLVPVKPFPLSGPDVRNPAVGQLLGRVIHAQIFSFCESGVIDGRLDEVARDIAFVIATMIGRPALRPSLAVSQYVSGLQIAIRHLGSKDDWNPALQRRAHQLLCFDNLSVALRIDHKGDAHGLNSLVNPCVGKHKSLVPAVRFATVCFSRLDEVVDSAVPAHDRNVSPFAHCYAVRNPTHNKSLGP